MSFNTNMKKTPQTQPPLGYIQTDLFFLFLPRQTKLLLISGRFLGEIFQAHSLLGSNLFGQVFHKGCYLSEGHLSSSQVRLYLNLDESVASF